MAAKLIGTDMVLKNLNKEVQKIAGRTKSGLVLGAEIIKGESMVNTPVDFNNLRPSHYVNGALIGKNPVAEVGVTADYGLYVHENLEAKHEVGTAKFLENAIKTKMSAVLSVIQKTARIR